MAKGYNGKILRVNLTSGKISTDSLEDTFCRKYIGGAGFIAYYLMKELKPGIDPLSPDNKLMFMGGPVAGLPVSGSAKIGIGTKSPLSNGYVKSEVSGFFGAEMRHAGFDGIIIEGKAAKPVYLWIHDGEAQIRDAGGLWGKTTKETQTAIRAELGDERIRLAMIGPGGENLVKIACIICDLKEAAGRGGSGAVMGSKNLKAVAVRGTKMPEIAKPDALAGFRQFLQDNPKLWEPLATYGTGSPASMASSIPIGNIPIRNFRDGDFPVQKIDGGTLKSTIGVGMEGCYACVVRCKKMVKVDEPGLKVDPDYGGPEYETLGSMGSTCGVEDLRYISKANELCGAYSLDTIATGVTVAFAMECYENGLLTNKDTGGIDLRFGNGEALVKAIELIAIRQGLGDILAEGTKRAAEKIGKGAERFAINVKGLEIPMHDPRAKAALGIGYATNPQGADHCMNMHDTAYVAPNPALDQLHPLGFIEPMPAHDLSPKKVLMFKYVMESRLICDHLTVCQFVPYTPELHAELLKAATGWDTGLIEMFRVCDRTLTLARMFNLREGLSAADDKLPERLHQQHVGGPSAKNPRYDKGELEKAVKTFYTLMGWNDKGVPTPETLNMLDIDWASKG